MSEDKGSNMMWQVISYNYYKIIELNWIEMFSKQLLLTFLLWVPFSALSLKKKGLSKEVVLQLLLEYC